MKKKQFMSKLAALTMAAAMGITALPATAVFAAGQSVTVDASDAIVAANIAITENGTAVNLNRDTVAKAIATKLQKGTVDTTNWTVDKLNTVLAGTVGSAPNTTTVTVTAATLTGTTGTATIVAGNGKTYEVTASAVAALKAGDITSTDATSKDAKDVLDDYFETAKISKPANGSVNAAVVQAAVNSGVNFGTFASGTTVKATVASATVSSDGSSVSGRIIVEKATTGSATNYYYDYTADVTDLSSSDLQAAIAKVAQTAYADQPTGTVDGKTYDTNALAKKVVADINAELGDKGSVSLPASIQAIKTAPTYTTNGSYTFQLSDGTSVTVPLKWSSNNKLTDAKTAFDTLAGSSLNTTNGAKFYLASTASTAGTDQKADAIAVFAPSSDLSRSIQARDALKAVDKDDVDDAVLAAVNAEVAKEGLQNDGVKYEAELVDGYYEISASNASTNTVATQKDATVSAGDTGVHVVKVTASIANDYNGWTKDGGTTKDTDATAKRTFYVVVETGTLKAKAATAVSVADKTVTQKSNYTYTLSGVTTGTPVDVIDLKATLTPADSNATVTWSVKAADKDSKDSDALVAQADGSTLTADSDSNHKNLAVTNTSGKLIVLAPGKYEVTATVAGNVTDKAVITVLNNFSDNKTADSYYYVPVKWAYLKNVTAGVSGSEFGVNQTVTRSQFVTWLYNLAVANGATTAIKDADVVATYSDVPTSAYYAKAVQWAKAAGVASGTGNGEFAPNKEISRAQALTMVYNYAGKPDTGAVGSDTESTTKFTDLKSGAYYVPAVTWAVKTLGRNDRDKNGTSFNGTHIASGKSVTAFDPEGDCTRAQAITFVYRAFAATDGSEVVK